MITDNQNIEYEYLKNTTSCMGVHVNGVGFQQINPHESYPVKSHPQNYYFYPKAGRKLEEFQLIYITKGEGTLQFETEQHTLKEGSIFMISPGQWHSYSPSQTTGWNEYYIGFNGENAVKWIVNSKLRATTPVFNIGFNEEMVRIFNRAIELAKSNNRNNSIAIAGLVYHILGLLLYEINNPDTITQKDIQLIEKSKIIMHQCIFTNLSPEQVAEKLSLGYTSFRKKFKVLTGLTPGSYMKEIKINKAKQLLLESALPVKEIAFRLNFCSPENFTTKFKKKTGFTPSGFRTGK